MSSPTIFALRHSATVKNSHGIQGRSDLDAIVPEGQKQIELVANKIRHFKILQGITYFPTPQAKNSALALSRLTQLPVESPLSLEPYDLGIASGRTHEELRLLDPKSAFSLELFRNRSADVRELQIRDAEDVYAVEKRLLRWWEDEGKIRCINRVLVGSNSTLVMLTNLLNGSLPSSGGYKCYGIPNGAWRVWTFRGGSWRTSPTLSVCRWPEAKPRTIQTQFGAIQATYYYPGWAPRMHSSIIIPGYFGNSRLGPYALFVRLARALAFNGIECTTMDYLGSGESSPLTRTFDLDVFSVNAVISQISNRKAISLIGHSVNTSVVAHICHSRQDVSGFALAPGNSMHDLRQTFLSREEYKTLTQTGLVTRRGVDFRLEYVKSALRAWRKGRSRLKAVILAGEDQYVGDYKALTSRWKVPVYSIHDADHNFSSANSSEDLINILDRLLGDISATI